MSEERYEKIKAIIDCGELRWEYKLQGNSTPGRMNHDEDVDGWSDDDIRKLTVASLDVDKDQTSLIEIEYR